MNKKKIICSGIIAGLFFLSLLMSLLIGSIPIHNPVACIYSDGELIRTIELNENDDYSFEVISENGGSNTICVKGGKISVSHADCPDKICVNTAAISDGLQPIVCVPNRLVIRIETKKPENSGD